MDLRIDPEQQQLVDAFASLYAKEATPERVRAAEAAPDQELWKRLCEIGVIDMAVGEKAGGWGASLLDLTLVAEQQGRALAPAPVIEVQVAVRLLERLGAGPSAECLRDVMAHQRMATVALRPASESTATMVPAGAGAELALVRDGERILLVTLDGHARPVTNLGGQPLADVDTSDGTVLAEGLEAVAAWRGALDDWQTLTAAALVGAGARALEIGIEYVKVRQAWGRPVGSYQSVSHTLANCATALDGARLLAYEAAWAAADLSPRASELSAMAFGFAYEAARDTTYASLHYHGGYGFMIEYDIQLYYRRVRSWALSWGNPAHAFQRVADARYGPATPRTAS